MSGGMRRPLVAGNWKMNLSEHDAACLASGIVGAAKRAEGAVDCAVFPSFVHLSAVRDALISADAGPTKIGGEAGGPIVLGAQDVYFEGNGAFTGEVSLEMLADVSASSVLVGHSERRHVLGEDDGLLRRKLAAAIGAGFTGVLCIGETLEQREAGETDGVNERQLRAGLEGLTLADAERLVVAYEPVWAIGTGKTATPEDAQAAHAKCREVLADIFDDATADRTRILYGGSMKPGNAGELVAMPDIDGGLIGGASLKVDDFGAIIEAAASLATA